MEELAWLLYWTTKNNMTYKKINTLYERRFDPRGQDAIRQRLHEARTEHKLGNQKGNFDREKVREYLKRIIDENDITGLNIDDNLSPEEEAAIQWYDMLGMRSNREMTDGQNPRSGKPQSDDRIRGLRVHHVRESVAAGGSVGNMWSFFQEYFYFFQFRLCLPMTFPSLLM